MTRTYCAGVAIALVLLLGWPSAGTAQPSAPASLGAGQLPITFMPNGPFTLSSTQEIEISGTISGGPATIALRVDDKWGATYAERFNLERPFPAGAFTLRVPAADLKSGDGRALNLQTIRQIVLFTTSGGPVEITAFRTVGAAGPASPTPQAAAPSSAEPAAPASLGAGQLPITFMPNGPFTLSSAQEIEISGTISGGPATIALRVDDKWGATYAERFNLERPFPAGAFTLRVPAADLKAGDGRALNLQTIRQIVLFTTSGGPVEITAFRAVGAAGPASPTPQAAAPTASTAPSSSQPAAPASLGTGQLPITFMPNGPFTLSSAQEIEISGTISGGPATIALRVDDKWGATYAERFNLERPFPAGAFTLRVPAADLKAGDGRALNLQTIRQIVLFTTSGGPVEITAFRTVGSGGGGTGTSNATAAQPTPAAQAIGPAGTAPPRSLGIGRATIRFEPRATINASGRQLVVEGTIEGQAVQTVFLRIDDAQSRDYPSRVGVERSFPPGPFRFQIGVDGLRTPNGRTMDMRNVLRIIFGPYPETGKVVVSRFELIETASLPDGAKGYALGAKEATLPAGFERIAPGDIRLNGPAVAVRRRPRPDPIVANGLRGLSRIRLPAEAGRARVTVWSEDPGEWEQLPQVLNRSIRVNGVTLLEEKLTPAQWVKRRYLRGLWQEHTSESDAWTAFGALRGDRRTIEVPVGREGITLEIDGGLPDERFVSAVLVERSGSNSALEQVERERAEWFRTGWRVVAPSEMPTAWPLSATPPSMRVHLGAAAAQGERPTLRAKAAPGTGVRLVLEATAAQRIEKPVFRLNAPQRAGAGTALPAQAWAGLWKLTQRETGLSLLTLWDEQLMSDVSRLPIMGEGDKGSRPRRYELWVDVPLGSPPGRYVGRVTIGREGATVDVPIEIDVLEVSLPEPRKPVGFYLTYPHHTTWRGYTRLDRERQSKCDMTLLTRFGLTGSSPPVTAPLRDGLDTIVGETQAARNAGFAPGWLLYDPLKDLRHAYGEARAASIAAATVDALKRRNLPVPVFTAADEPSNPEQFTTGLQNWLTALRRDAPEVKIAGHLNTPADAAIAGQFDVAMINSGFGIDLAGIDRLAGTGKRVWIYNTFEPRLTAGFWITYSKAERYLQWHARMPTADPFDPLDGRELDVQVIYPNEAVCATPVDINRDLLRLAEGVVDQRWLLWLEARTEPQARQLSQKLRARIGTTWSAASKLTDRELAGLRDEITALAERLGK